MSTDALYPLIFQPVFRDYMWGGRRLEQLYGRRLPPGIVAESWEISAHPSAPTPVANGPYAGVPLPDLTAQLGDRLLGTRARGTTARDRFPLLVKLLDANRDLSVQVHPDDAYALAHEGDLGKTEMWYVLHADPGAEIVYGLCPGTTRETLSSALAEGRVEEVLQRVPVRPHDAIHVPAGTVHALLTGLVVAEIQENSDTTYRLYDWGRPGPDGQPRPLHTDKALDVIAFGTPPPGVPLPELLADGGGIRVERLVSCPQFCVERVTLHGGARYPGLCDGATFEIWGTVQGRAVLEAPSLNQVGLAALPLAAVAWTVLPAEMGAYAFRAEQDACTLLRAYLPPRA